MDTTNTIQRKTDNLGLHKYNFFSTKYTIEKKKTQVTHRNICIIYPWKEVRGQHLVMVLVLLLVCCCTRLAGPLASPGATSHLPTEALGLQMCVAVLKFMSFLEIRTQVLTLLWQALLGISSPPLSSPLGLDLYSDNGLESHLVYKQKALSMKSFYNTA